MFKMTCVQGIQYHTDYKIKNLQLSIYRGLEKENILNLHKGMAYNKRTKKNGGVFMSQKNFPISLLCLKGETENICLVHYHLWGEKEILYLDWLMTE